MDPSLPPSQVPASDAFIQRPFDECVKKIRDVTKGSVLVIGSGGLGCPALQYLTAAGVGRIGVVDFDVVEASNLQRQTLFGYEDLGRPKAEVAAERLKDLNPHVEITSFLERFAVENALSLLEDYDVVLDGSDNFPTRYLVNDACVLLGKPNVYGSIFRFEGQVSVFYAKEGPCYRCLYPEPPPPGLVPSCAEGGVLGVLPGIIGAMQALETIKLIIGCEKAFDIRLKPREIIGLQNVGEMVDHLIRHLDA